MNSLETRWQGLVDGTRRGWWPSAARGALHLLATLYGGALAGYRAGYDLGLIRSHRLPCAVISIGNLTVGGTGKTTAVRWLARRLREWGSRPAILSRGYGAERGGSAPTVVADPDGIREPLERSGDEAQLLARSLPGVPMLTGRARTRSGQLACERYGVDVCLLDDGFQYWRLRKDLEILLVNATNPFGNGRLFPRGVLREPLTALRRAAAVVVTHAAWVDPAERERLRARLLRWNPDLVLAEARHTPVALRSLDGTGRYPLDELREGRWLAVSGLGDPRAFERTLIDLGARPPEALRFPDHHTYQPADLRRMVDRVRAEDLAGVVTTEKDAVKLPPGALSGIRGRVLEIDLELLRGEDALVTLIRSRLGAGAAAAVDQAP